MGGSSMFTTTAYRRTSATTARPLFLYLSGDGGTVQRRQDAPVVVVPAGTFRFLAVTTPPLRPPAVWRRRS